MSKDPKQRAAFFSPAEQKSIIRLYEEYKDIITRKGNTSAINKAREAAWQSVADRLNATNNAGVKRTWQQVKIKYKNILQNATRNKTADGGVGGAAHKAALVPAKELKSGPVIAEIKGGASSDPFLHETKPCVKVMKDVLTLLDPPVFDNDEEIAGLPRMVEENEDKESKKSDEMAEPEDPHASTSRTHTSASERKSEIREVYKRYLLQEIECKKMDLLYKKLKMRKLELEIKNMEKETQQYHQ